MSLKIKYLGFITLTLCVALLVTIYKARQASYAIQITGELYIINKLSQDIQIVDLYTGKEVAAYPIGIEAHEAISAFDQNVVVLSNYGSTDNQTNVIKLIDTKTRQIEKVIALDKGSNANGLVDIDSPHHVLMVDYINNRLSFLNIESQKVDRYIPTHQEKSHLSVLHPHRPIAYVTNMVSNSISVIDLMAGEIVSTIACGKTTESIDITPDGQEVWATNKDENSISIINTNTHEVIQTIASGNEPLKLKFTVDGEYCLVANASDGTLHVIEQQSRKLIRTIEIPGKEGLIERTLFHTPRPVNMVMHPNGKYVFVANSNARKVEVVSTESWHIIGNIATGKVPDALVLIDKNPRNELHQDKVEKPLFQEVSTNGCPNNDKSLSTAMNL